MGSNVLGLVQAVLVGQLCAGPASWKPSVRGRPVADLRPFVHIKVPVTIWLFVHINIGYWVGFNRLCLLTGPQAG